jgi:adenine phosphoribosyltransferase
VADSLAAARAAIAARTRHVPDFPEPGVVFADLTPVFADGAALAAVIDGLAEFADGADLVAGIDARGFLLGSGVALRLGTGLLAVRKGGKLPPPVLSENYDLEYGSATLEIPGMRTATGEIVSGIDLHGRTALVVDDVLATGGTVGATTALLRRAGATVRRVAVVVELAGLGGRTRLAEMPGGAVEVGALSVG